MLSTAPSSSQAAVLRQFRTPLRIEEVPVPKAIEPGAILTRIETCSICGTDIHLWQGSLALKVELPVIIGHEMVGRIVALGSGAERDSIGQTLRAGDRITWTHTSCGSCFYCTVAQEPTLCQHSRMYMYESMTNFPHLVWGVRCQATFPSSTSMSRSFFLESSGELLSRDRHRSPPHVR